jgi:N-acetylglucosamine-6-phosphate deacetylase
LIDGDRIADFGQKIYTDGAECVDAQGAYTGPGLVDIHTHAANDIVFSEHPAVAANYLLSCGVTDVLPALYFNSTKEELLSQISLIRMTMDSGKAPNILGIYMEAPYKNPKFGCNRENNPWRHPINREDYSGLIEAAGSVAKVWCVAPEREGIYTFAEDVRRINPKAIFSVAHSEAIPSQIEPLIEKGLKLATHHTNATGTINKYPECRGVCVDETVLYNDDIYAELILRFCWYSCGSVYVTSGAENKGG